MIDPDAALQENGCAKKADNRLVLDNKSPDSLLRFGAFCLAWLRIRNAYGRRRPDGRGQLFLGTGKRSYGSSLSSLSITRQSGASLRS